MIGWLVPFCSRRTDSLAVVMASLVHYDQPARDAATTNQDVIVICRNSGSLQLYNMDA